MNCRTTRPNPRAPWSILLLLVVFACRVTAVEDRAAIAAESGKKPMTETGEKQSADAFAQSLFAQLPSEGNLAVSPASIESCVLLALAGARGETADAIAAALQLGNYEAANIGQLLKTSRLGGAQVKNGPQLTAANSAWVDRAFPVKDAYRELLETDAGATFEAVDFAGAADAARLAINAWIDRQTNHKIPELLRPGAVNSTTRLVLVNAIYFKGRWHEPFPKWATRKAPFHRPGQPDVRVPLMHLEHRFRYLETDTYQAVEIPYENSPYAMVVWLPRQVDGLAKLEADWTRGRAGSLEDLATVGVDLYLPRFRVERHFSLREVLSALGMGQAFAPAADFSGISDQGLLISEVFHQALVETDEEGSEAAAATALPVRGSAAQPVERVEKVFRADHPFLFAIRHSATGDILFLGRVETPQK